MQLPNRTTKIVGENPWRDDEQYINVPLHDGPKFQDGPTDDNDDFGSDSLPNPEFFLSSVRFVSPFHSE
jgi:hypothetical protein